MKHFGTIHAADFKWKPSGCEVAMMEAFVMQVSPYVTREMPLSTFIELNVFQVAAFYALSIWKIPFVCLIGF
jgi:hypothetical protein